MTVRAKNVLALIGMFTAIPQIADAAEYRMTYNGTITDGADTDNIFGLFGQNLAGLGLRADLTYTTSVPGTRTSSPTSDEVAGGDAFGTAAVISSAVFTVGSASFTFSPSYYGDLYTSSDFISAYGFDVFGNSLQTYIFPDNKGEISLQTPFSSTGIGDKGGASTQFSYFIAGNDTLDFNASSIMIAAIPEPATWAMMLVGFAAIGLAMRRRDKKIGTLVPLANSFSDKMIWSKEFVHSRLKPRRRAKAW